MSTVSIIDKKVSAQAIAWKWPGAVVACKKTGAHTFIEWDDAGPVPVKTAQEIADAQDEYRAALAAKAYIPARAAAYESAILTAKNYREGDKITGLGFFMDVVISEIRALRAGQAQTAEFSAVCALIDGVKQAIPKP